MCFALYIATEQPVNLSEYAGEEWLFSFAALGSEEDIVAKHFTNSNVYYAAPGDVNNCGCDWFAYEPDEDIEEDEDERAESDRAKLRLKLFADFLQLQLKSASRVEIYLCWEGECGGESNSPRLELSPEDFRSDHFPMDKRDFATVRTKSTRLRNLSMLLFHWLRSSQ